MAAINSIRERSWLLIGIMVISLIAFLLMGTEGDGGQGSFQQSDDLAIVNGEAVSNQVFNDNLNNNVANYRTQTKQQILSDADMNGIRNSTYDQMVNEKLLNKIYTETGIAVSDEEFLDMLGGKNIHAGIKNSFKDATGNFDRNAFTNYINSLDLENNPSDEPGTKRKAWKNFENAIIKERLTTKYNSLVEGSTTVPSFMAKDQFTAQKAQVNFQYVKVPYSAIADSSLNLTDADLKNFVSKHAKEYQQEETADIKFASFPIIASENDKMDASKWIAKKVGEWPTVKSDSLFISLYSDVPYDEAYYGANELSSQYTEAIFKSELGAIFGPDQAANSFVATKLLDKKMIPDSLKARHLLISLEGVTTQEDASSKYALYDSLFNLIDSEGYTLSSLTAQFSDDNSNANTGGELNWVKPNQMVKPFNDLIFFNMKEGDIKKVNTEFGLHIVEVYRANPTKLAVKVATLKKDILPSTKTQEKIYAAASIFSGNNNTQEKFEAAEETTIINNAFGVAKDANLIQKINGNARQIIKWAFNAKKGEVSSPFSIGEAYHVVLAANNNEKGLMQVNDNNRLQIEVAAAKSKKAEILKAKMLGSDLNVIAAANNVVVQTSQSASFINANVGGFQENKVIGESFGLAENTVSKAIEGSDGVFVISVTSKVAAPEDENSVATLKSTLKTQLKTSVSSRMSDALRKEADVVDNRFNFF
tara:strand:+ start:3702 stop:5816 length:2115 start_codon:yes stop_codon:yes gene_type:complete